MRRGQSLQQSPEHGFTKAELVEAAQLSPKTFDTLRKAARVPGPNHGGMTHMFSLEQVVALVDRAESGTFSERGGQAASAWRAMLLQHGIDPPPRKSRR